MGQLFFISLLGYAFAFAAFFKLKIGAALICAVNFLIYLSYLTVIILGLYNGTPQVIILSGFVLLIISIFYLKKENRLLEMLSPSLLVFAALSVLCLIAVDRFLYLDGWDSYSYWGTVVKEMFLYKSHITGYSDLGFTDYNPAFGALRYAIVDFFAWKEKYLTYPVIALLSASLAFMCDNFDWKKSPHIFLSISFTFISLIFIFPYYQINTLQPDIPMFLVFSVLLFSWINRKDNSAQSYLPIVICAGSLATYKLYIGFMLGSILAVYMLCSFIYAKRYENAEKNNISFKPAVLAVLLVLFIQISYSVYYNYNTLKADADRKADIAKYLDKDTLGTVKKPPLGIYLLKGNPRNERLKGNFTNEVLIERTKLYFNTINKSVINNNRAMAAIIMIILLFAALLKFAKGSLRNTIKKNLILMCIIFTLYFIGFYFTLLVEPWANSSAWRYISSALNMFLPAGYYYFAVIFSGGMIRQKTSYAALDIEKTKNNIFYAAYIIFVSAMLFSHINISSQIKKYKTQYNNETALQMDKEIKTIKPFINPNDRVLLIIHTKADTLDYHKCKYFSYYFVLPSISKVLPHPADKDIKQLEKFIQDSAIKFRASKLIIWRPLELIDTKNLDEKFKDGYSALLPVSRHKELPWIFEISVNKGSLTFTLIN